LEVVPFDVVTIDDAKVADARAAERCCVIGTQCPTAYDDGASVG
jgi:hypothetical protein